MTYYKLYLIRDTRNSEARIAYNYIIGKSFKLKDYYYKKVKVWDMLSRSWHKQEVLLKAGNPVKNIIPVEIVRLGV